MVREGERASEKKTEEERKEVSKHTCELRTGLFRKGTPNVT